jgi:outer membrane protein assembly factor BamC
MGSWNKGLFAFTLLVSLQGCGLFGEDGYFRDREDDYLKAESLPPLALPPGLDEQAIEDIYVVPPIDKYAQRPEEFAVPRPQGLVAGEFDDMVKIQTLDQEQWILVRLLPGQVWPRLKDFLLTRGLGVASEDGARGFMQTQWSKDPQLAQQERYRFALEQGLQRNSSEIHLVQMQRSAGSADAGSTQWPEQSDDAQKARLMLLQFANYLAETADVNASVSLVAQGISTSRRLYLVGGDSPVIRAQVEPDRGWASLENALEKAGFTINESDRETGAYMVSLDPNMQQVKKGMWSRFFGVFKPSSYAEVSMEEFQFRVTMSPSAEAGWQEIRIVNPQAEASGEAIPEAQQQMLGLIKGYLT